MKDLIKRVLKQDLNLVDGGAMPLMGQTARIVRAGYEFDCYHTCMGMVIKNPEDGAVLGVVKHGINISDWLQDNTRSSIDCEVYGD